MSTADLLLTTKYLIVKYIIKYNVTFYKAKKTNITKIYLKISNWFYNYDVTIFCLFIVYIIILYFSKTYVQSIIPFTKYTVCNYALIMGERSAVSISQA